MAADRNTLVEKIGSCTRESIRNAPGFLREFWVRLSCGEIHEWPFVIGPLESKAQAHSIKNTFTRMRSSATKPPKEDEVVSRVGDFTGIETAPLTAISLTMKDFGGKWYVQFWPRVPYQPAEDIDHSPAFDFSATLPETTQQRMVRAERLSAEQKDQRHEAILRDLGYAPDGARSSPTAPAPANPEPPPGEPEA